MNQARMRESIRGLSSIAKKVLEVVPITEAWSPQQITTELRRTGSTPDLHIVRGCLNTLKAADLIREAPTNHFTKVVLPSGKHHDEEKVVSMVRMKEPAPKEPAPKEPAPKKPEPQQDEGRDIKGMAIDKLAEVAASARAAAEQLLAIAKTIDDVAIEIEDRVQRSEANSAKLRQLQSLLKDLGN